MPLPIFELILLLLDLCWWIIIVAVVVSWLIAFGVINVYNHAARSFVRALDALTEPVFRRVRKIVPAIGGLDLSPVLVLIVIWFLEEIVRWLAGRYAI